MRILAYPLFALCMLAAPAWPAEPEAPWGRAKVVEQSYTGQKVVYDVSVKTEAEMRSVISRARMLADINGADPFDSKVVIVMHGDEIPFFALKNYAKHKDLMQRAQSATQSGVVEFRMCRPAAHGYGLAPKDIHGFVTMVPMADAEIARLQHEGYAYMR